MDAQPKPPCAKKSGSLVDLASKVVGSAAKSSKGPDGA